MYLELSLLHKSDFQKLYLTDLKFTRGKCVNSNRTCSLKRPCKNIKYYKVNIFLR